MNGSAMDCSEARLRLLDDQRGRLDVGARGSAGRSPRRLRRVCTGRPGRAPLDRAARAPPSPARRSARAQAPARRRVGDVNASGAACLRSQPTRRCAGGGRPRRPAGRRGRRGLGRPVARRRPPGRGGGDRSPRLLARADALDVRSGDVHQLRPWPRAASTLRRSSPSRATPSSPCAAAPPSTSSTAAPPRQCMGAPHAITLLVVGRIDDLASPVPGRPLTTTRVAST